VKAAGAAVAAVCVTAFGENFNVGDATTDHQGNYRISSLPADRYTVEFDPTCSGLQASPYAPQYYKCV
jgi:hypothetical protein